MTAPSAHLDRTQLLATAKRIRRAADALVKNTEATLDELKKQAGDCTSVNTKMQSPAPLYKEALDTLEQGIEDARSRVAGIAEDLRSDADLLEQVARESASAEAAGVRDLDAEDPQLPETNNS